MSSDRKMINDALRVVRKYWGLSQVELANELQISQPLISEIESGSKQVTLDVIERYSDKLGIRMSQLLFFAEDLDLIPKNQKSKNNISRAALNLLERVLPDEKED